VISIIIPTYGNHLETDLKPCIESIIKHTDLSDVEIIISANGCTDNTKEYVEGLGTSFELLWTDEATGFSKANNLALKEAKGDYIVFLNNDTIIQSSNWLDLLKKPFENKKVGVVGPIMHTEVGFDFIIFFCAMISREVFEIVGYLDEDFGVGSMEDVDYCIRAKEAGFTLATTDGQRRSTFPVIHKAETTMHHLPQGRDWWEKHFRSNQEKLSRKWAKLRKHTVTAVVSTKGRYFSTLSNTLISIANQTHKVEKILLFDDNDVKDRKDLREVPLYTYIFNMLSKKGIELYVEFGEGKGQVLNHQKSIERCKTEWIWRLDDDNIAEPDVLEKLLSVADEKTGAVGGCVLDPSMMLSHSLASSKMEDIYLGVNEQWFKITPKFVYKPYVGVDGYDGPREIDHLYSTFVYRKEAAKHGYCMELSKVGHREETVFTVEMRRNGWKLLFNPQATTWHFRNPEGGIRSEKDSIYWKYDELVFEKKLKEWGITPKQYKIIALDNGLGDHCIFKKILPEVQAKYPNLILATCYPEVFNDTDVKQISLSEAHMVTNVTDQSIYNKMIDWDWKDSLENAFRKLYL